MCLEFCPRDSGKFRPFGPLVLTVPICNHSAHNRKADLVARLLEEERLKKKRKREMERERERAPQEVVEEEVRETPTRQGNPRHACGEKS